jgi:Arc/MetJ family transcription regulator
VREEKQRVTYSQRVSREVSIVRTTINLDDELLEEARRLTGIADRTALIHAGLRALVERESARRLARLGGRIGN